MGGKSSYSKTVSDSTTKKILGDTTTSNPYVNSITNSKGSTSDFVQGSAFESINDFFNDNVQDLLNSYLKPSLNTVTNQANLNEFNSSLNSLANQNMENNIINPLSSRNMLRSSQATDMYNNLQQSLTDSIASYTNELLASSQENTANMLNNLMDMYLNGFDAISANQNQSLNTSANNSTQTNNGSQTNFGVGLEASVDDAVKLASLLGK